MPNSSDSSTQLAPDYGQIVKFLLEPLVDDPASLKVDCERLSSTEKVWVRVAFEQEDKGKVFGRGGRNLKAIQTVLDTSAIETNHQVYLDVYGSSRDDSSRGSRSGGSRGRGGEGRRRSSSSRRPRAPKPSPQLRSNGDG
ncbi:KH domain-containing protein [[Limnothrix rosea] IAM M-220]|uniref:KH domain-containing protein n=1 Tax=[Limnothrix rosea] IAM M-220 TaxID=454133 RepID=UPI0009642256|nr:KH domain-containing protein [[Limnothrix rosea] IAM M-220]OKH19367.1 RNA-binding protein [[Limnothrix rosea] IAM M-220]